MNMRTKASDKPRRARADTGTKNPRRIAEQLYTDAFLAEVQQQFEFDAIQPETTTRLRDIARRYILGRRIENQPNLLKADRRRYQDLQKATERYISVLKKYQDDDLGSDMALAAEQLDGALPETPDPERHYLQIVFLLEALRTVAIRQAGHLATRAGRPKNFGLEDLVRHAAEFWIGALGRPFRIDYHQGAGVTRAFEFIRALVTPIDDVSDRQIVTAMRAEIAKRRSPGPPKAKQRLTTT
jgi:hypothetical protein